MPDADGCLASLRVLCELLEVHRLVYPKPEPCFWCHPGSEKVPPLEAGSIGISNAERALSAALPLRVSKADLVKNREV